MIENENRDRARSLVAEHNRRALQLLVDEIVAAVRAGDDANVTALDRQLRYAEQILERAELLARQHAEAERARRRFHRSFAGPRVPLASAVGW